MDCIVKFTYRYSRAAHKLMEREGVATRLMYCNREPLVGLYCVVTEYVRQSKQARLSQEGANKLRAALDKFQEHSFVHGDLRELNILIDAEGGPLLIDFDWSGKEGEVYYPVRLNMEIEWAAGIGGGKKIEGT